MTAPNRKYLFTSARIDDLLAAHLLCREAFDLYDAALKTPAEVNTLAAARSAQVLAMAAMRRLGGSNLGLSRPGDPPLAPQQASATESVHFQGQASQIGLNCGPG